MNIPKSRPGIGTSIGPDDPVLMAGEFNNSCLMDKEAAIPEWRKLLQNCG